jgi:hypothetical protein
MAIRIKHSETAGNPPTLVRGELAYSALSDNGVNGGDRLYIGTGVEIAGDAANHVVIGGKYFTDKLDHTPGIVNPGSALIVDGSSKLNFISIDNITIDNNQIFATSTDSDLVMSPNGIGKAIIAGNAYPNTSGSTGQVLQTNGAGVLSWADIDTSSASSDFLSSYLAARGTL